MFLLHSRQNLKITENRMIQIVQIKGLQKAKLKKIEY